jgi:hypothetical protein
MTRFTRDPLYRRHRFPAEVIAQVVWLYFRFPLSLRMVEDMPAARGVIVSHQTVLRCGETGDHARRRASLAQRPEKSGGEFSSTDPKTGEDHEALQVSATASALRFHPRPDRQPL